MSQIMQINSDTNSRTSRLYVELLELINQAKKIVYELDGPTRLDRLELGDGRVVFAKREDTSRVHSYKWRGAFFKMHQLVAQGESGPFVAASAGNHAQGVAIAANHLKVPAIIFMPRTTPHLKQDAVASLGGPFVEIRLHGDRFDDAAIEAAHFLARSKGIMIRPFDDLSVIAGQATVGLEMFDQNPDLTKVYIPIGGGGLASGMSFVSKVLGSRNCRIIGVEVDGQNSMQLSRAAGHRVEMKSVDGFCDGTAVSIPGEKTFEFCCKLLDDIVSVSNQQVSAAIKSAWENGRFIPEPSGAIGLAAAIKFADKDANDVVGTVISGSNMDFRTLPRIVNQSIDSFPSRKYFRFEIAERNGTLIELLDGFLSNINIVDFQYGKSDSLRAFPIVGVEGPPQQLHGLSARLCQLSFHVEELPPNAFLDYRVIPFQPESCDRPFFLRIDFPNRPGALLELMRRVSRITNICYFNFVDTGESEGHALIAFEPLQEDAKLLLIGHLADLNFGFANVGSRISTQRSTVKNTSTG